MKETLEEEQNVAEYESSLNHYCSAACCCEECQKQRKKYIQILDIDSYVENLNDWD